VSRRAASRRRRLARLRTTAPPILRVAVNPRRTEGSPSARSSCWTTTAPRAWETPLAAARNWGRLNRRSIFIRSVMRPALKGNGRVTSGRQALAALGAATRDNLLAVRGGHPRTEAVTALAHESRRLIGPLHGRLRVTGVGDRHKRQPRERRAYKRRQDGSQRHSRFSVRSTDAHDGWKSARDAEERGWSAVWTGSKDFCPWPCCWPPPP